MRKIKVTKWMCVGAFLLCMVGLSGRVSATQLDLNDFFQFPDDSFGTSVIDVLPDGSTADFVEDPIYTPVALSNDPGLGDPNIIIPGTGVHLLFDYVFNEGSSDDDEFGAFILDGNTGLSVGPAYEFFLGSSGSGTIDWNLTSFSGQLLGLQFQLSALGGDVSLNSTLTISNVRLVTQGVPEPSTILLIGLGLTLFGWHTVAYRKS